MGVDEIVGERVPLSRKSVDERRSALVTIATQSARDIACLERTYNGTVIQNRTPADIYRGYVAILLATDPTVPENIPPIAYARTERHIRTYNINGK